MITSMKLDNIIHTNLGGVKTACVSRHELVLLISQRVLDFRDSNLAPLVIFSANGHGIALANSDEAFMKLLHRADIVHADGQSLVLMSRFFAPQSIPERSATTDMIHDIPRLSDKQHRHFLLGGKADIVDASGEILVKTYPNFELVGTRDGYAGIQNTENLIEEINNAKPDVLWVGLGKPLEQQWVMEHKHKLKVPVIISCGGCYNYITGDYKRAPLWMQNIGLEWLHRAMSKPKALLWRYIKTNPYCIYCVIKHRFFT